MPVFDITILRRAHSSGDTFYIVNNRTNPPLEYKFIDDAKSLDRFQEFMDMDDLPAS